MRFVRVMSIAVILALGVQPARAETIWEWTHAASGSGTANVFDGGPPRTESGDTVVPDNPWMVFGATDLTCPGTLCASASAGGNSFITTRDNEMTIWVELEASYSPSLFGGDNPGGMAEASLFSVIEFVMPSNELDWIYSLWIDQRNPFNGSTSVVFENVTQSETLLTLTSTTGFSQTTLVANPGDALRLTTTMSGMGTMGPGSGKEYDSELGMVFAIPEPQTLILVLLGTAFLHRNGRRHDRKVFPRG